MLDGAESISKIVGSSIRRLVRVARPRRLLAGLFLRTVMKSPFFRETIVLLALPLSTNLIVHQLGVMLGRSICMDSVKV